MMTKDNCPCCGRPVETQQADKLISLPAVKELTGLGTTKIYGMIKEGSFPKQVKMSAKAARWSHNEIQAWVQARKENRVAGNDDSFHHQQAS